MIQFMIWYELWAWCISVWLNSTRREGLYGICRNYTMPLFVQNETTHECTRVYGLIFYVIASKRIKFIRVTGVDSFSILALLDSLKHPSVTLYSSGRFFIARDSIFLYEDKFLYSKKKLFCILCILFFFIRFYLFIRYKECDTEKIYEGNTK